MLQWCNDKDLQRCNGRVALTNTGSSSSSSSSFATSTGIWGTGCHNVPAAWADCLQGVYFPSIATSGLGVVCLLW
jgi:hypothetical protein